jgi:iron complex outermembrane receptor protein
MSKFFMLSLCMAILYNVSFGQTNHKLKGVVVDESNAPLVGASVFLSPIKEGTITNESGEFIIDDLPNDNYVIEISFIGYNTLVDTIKIIGDRTYNAKLKEKTQSLHEVVITDHYAETRKKGRIA